MKTIYAADLFCGAGGTSSGLKKACEDLGYKLHLLAINHWDVAIATHLSNHPDAEHMCESLDNVNPRKAVPGGYLDLLVASPECTHHSIARGGKPMSDQSRASGWHILRWAEALRIENILIENVKEFRGWGPLGVNGRPLKRRKGETFLAFINALRALNYSVEYRVLNAADYGDPTTRERLFVMARRGRKEIVWPEPTHTPTGEDLLFGKTKRWRTAREILDWSIKGASIFKRKRPLAPNTVRRIAAGLRKFCGKEIEPFLVMLYKSNDARSIDRPMPTVTAQGGHIGLVEPIEIDIDDAYWEKENRKNPILKQSRGTVLPKPFLVQFNNNSQAQDVDHPLPTIMTKDKFGLCRPFLVKYYGTAKTSSVDKPLPAVTTKDRCGVVQPFIVGIGQTGGNGKRIRSTDSPLPTIVTKNEFAVCQPFIVPNFGERDGQSPRVHSIDKPLPTVTSHGAGALIQPEIKGYKLDIRFRMLQPHELARAMSFDDDYKFSGNREAQVKQIGNAVPVELARSLCRTLL